MTTIEPISESFPQTASHVGHTIFNFIFNTPFINGFIMGIPFFLALYVLVKFPKEQGRLGLLYGALAFAVSQFLKSIFTIVFPMYIAGKTVIQGTEVQNSTNLELFKVLLMTTDVAFAFLAMQLVPKIRSKDLQCLISPERLQYCLFQVCIVALGWTIAENTSFIVPFYTDASKWISVNNYSLTLALNLNLLRVTSMFCLLWVLSYKYTPMNLLLIGSCIYGLIMYCVLPTGLRLLALHDSFDSFFLSIIKTVAIGFMTVLTVFVTKGLSASLKNVVSEGLPNPMKKRN